MVITKRAWLILSFIVFTSFSWANNEVASSEALSVIEALVVSEPEKALISIDQLKNSKVQLTSTQKVMLIKHEAIANTYLNRHMLALEIIEKLKKVAGFESDKSFLWHYYSSKAFVSWYMDNIEDSLSFNLKAYDVVKSIETFRSYQAMSEGDIGYAFIKLGFYQQAIPYLESALQSDLVSTLTTVHVIDLASNYNNLGEAYLGIKNYKKSFELLNKSLAIRLEHQLIFHSSFSYQNLGRLYYAQKEYQQAETSFNKAIEIREQAGFLKGVLVSKLDLAKVYIANNKTLLAEEEIKTVIERAKNHNKNSRLSEAYRLQKNIYARNKEYQKAYQTSLLYEQALAQVVSSKTSAKLANYLNTSKAIAKDLNILELENNAKIKDLQVNSDRQKARIIIIFGFCIVIILVVFLWTVQKSKKVIAKSNADLSLTLTELKETQEKLIKSGKMAALTTLVSRMAHQVNTPLGIAVTGVSLIHEKIDCFEKLIAEGGVKKSAIDSLLSDLNKGSELSLNSMDKVAGLISQFKMISDNLEAESQQEFELFAHISKQADLILMTVKKNKPVINISGSKVLMLGFPEALNKVINQLITNSIDHAFEETFTPEIDIKISTINDKVEIIYQDNGKGIDATIVKDVFEPFYTTNMGNNNLGIGLSIVYNLVVQLMQGNIQCKTRQRGIMFCITLPLKIEGEILG
jgi:signal transduction histidine kinase